MYNEENNNENIETIDNTPEVNTEVVNDVQESVPTTETNTTIQDDYQYPKYDGDYNTENEEYEESNKKPKIILILLIILALLSVLGLGYVAYKYLWDNKPDVPVVDSITIENGILTPEFNRNVKNYNIETSKDKIRFICKYKGKIVALDDCNKDIEINDELTNYSIKVGNIKYNFVITRINENSPIIDSVTGNSKEWVKSLTLSVKATFIKEPDDKPYSFDGGKTWQKENTKAFSTNSKVAIIVKDKEGNVSSTYTENITKTDSISPKIEITGPTNKLSVITIKDNESGVVNYNVTTSNTEPKEWVDVKLTNSAVIKHTANSDGTYYVWSKDKVGNISYKKFNVGNVTENKEDTTVTTTETISINGISGNTTSWVNAVTLTVNAKSNLTNAKLNYSFDGGKNWQTSNSKRFTSNQKVNIVVKNSNTNVQAKTSANLTTIDSIAPVCNVVSGQNTKWKTSPVTITVNCKDDGGSKCTKDLFENTYSTTTKTSNIQIRDNAGNVTSCPVNVYVDVTGPKLTYQKMPEHDGTYKFWLFVTDNESGINLDTVKYKERIYENGLDKIWHKKWSASLELGKTGDIFTNYKFTKELGIYNYFTINVEDNLGNKTDLEISFK